MRKDDWITKLYYKQLSGKIQNNKYLKNQCLVDQQS